MNDDDFNVTQDHVIFLASIQNPWYGDGGTGYFKVCLGVTCSFVPNLANELSGTLGELMIYDHVIDPNSADFTALDIYITARNGMANAPACDLDGGGYGLSDINLLRA